MLKRTFTFTDYDGNERTEDHYFNLSEAEVLELQLTTDGGLTTMINRIVAAKDAKAIMKTFKDILSKAYGVKSPDGRRIEKSEELFKSFSETEAYSQLFVELCTDADAAAKFMEGILPQKETEQAPITPMIGTTN